MNNQNICMTDHKKIICEGNDTNKALGHPRVSLNMGEKNTIDCPYCGKHFQLNLTSKSKPEDH